MLMLIFVLRYQMNVFTDLKKWNAEEHTTNTKFVSEKSEKLDYLNFGKKVIDQILKVDNYKKNVFVEVPIDLSPALNNGIGHVVIVVSPTLKG
jgi:hypothetical protein